MKHLLLLLILAFAIPVAGQEDVRLTNLSSKYDLVAKQTNCNVDWRGGKCDATVRLYRKRSHKPFQRISIRAGDEPPIFGDFNFDGQEDLAICDGTNGGYVTASYRVYLYSRAKGQFIPSASFTALSQGPAMGFFEVDKRSKTLTTATKIGYGYFVQRKYDVFHGEPRLIFERIHDESSAAGDWAEITTKKLVRGKWRTWHKREKSMQSRSS